MTKKHIGKCPYCNEDVEPNVIEGNTMRRDKCQCPRTECGGILYVCRTPGCHNYAKGGDMYDDELCPECTSSLLSHSGDVVKTVLLTAASIAVAAASEKKG